MEQSILGGLLLNFFANSRGLPNFPSVGCESGLGGTQALGLPAARGKPPARTSTLLKVAVGAWWEQEAVRWEAGMRERFLSLCDDWETLGKGKQGELVDG